MNKIILILNLSLIAFLIFYAIIKSYLYKQYLIESLIIGTILATLYTSLSHFIKKVPKGQILSSLIEFFIFVTIIISLFFIFFKYPINENYDFIGVMLKTIIFFCLIRIILLGFFEKLNIYIKIFLGLIFPIILCLIYKFKF